MPSSPRRATVASWPGSPTWPGADRAHRGGDPLAEGGRYHDAQNLLSPAGAPLAVYKKAHLFAAERRWYAPGDAPMVVETAIGRLGLTICYDLIFPEYVRRLVEMGADIVVNSTDWIADAYQAEVWGWNSRVTQALASTRALENGVPVAMANRVGREEGFWSLGGSCIAGPSGRLLAGIESGEGLAVAPVESTGRPGALARPRHLPRRPPPRALPRLRRAAPDSD